VPVDPTPPPLSPREWPAWLAIGLGRTLAILPWSLTWRIGVVLGWLMRELMVKRHRVAARNLALCFPELDPRQRDVLLREHFRSLGIGLVEFMRAWWGRMQPMSAHCQVRGLEQIEKVRAQGRGVILLSPHFTTLEMCLRLLTLQVPVAGIYRPHDSAALEWAVTRGRSHYAAGMFARDELRPAVRYLKSGGVLWFAPDQETRRGDSVFVPFFGHPAWSLTSTHQLARLTGAAVLPLFHQRLADGSYELEIGAPLEDFPSRDATADTARVMATLEGLIRRCPAQYLWVHQRFKRQPDGAPSLYE
jgi:KDO2-lipid IV(A) lauroyltransferase